MNRHAIFISLSILAIAAIAFILIVQFGCLGLIYTETSTTTLQKKDFHANIDGNDRMKLGKHGIPSVQNQRKNITFIVPLYGEMCNNLSCLMYAKALTLWVLEQHNLQYQLEITAQHEGLPKWRSAMSNIKQCFPNLRDLNFHGGIWSREFKTRRQQQRQWLGKDTAKQLTVKKKCNNFSFCMTNISNILNAAITQQKDQHSSLHHQLRSPYSSNATIAMIEPQNAEMTLPFLRSREGFNTYNEMVEQYFEQLRTWLSFDEQACCKLRPDPDETVFHLRDYVGEKPKNALGRGFEELNPNQTVRELFANHQRGDRIAIVSRFVGPGTNAHKYKEVMENHGFRVRIIANQTSVEDFCFLMQTKKELVGIEVSTFIKMAAFLGSDHIQHIRLYNVNSSYTRKANKVRIGYPWKRNDMKSKIMYEIYSVPD